MQAEPPEHGGSRETPRRVAEPTSHSYGAASSKQANSCAPPHKKGARALSRKTAFASLPLPGRDIPTRLHPGPWDLLASAPWLILVYLGVVAGWTPEQIIGVLVVIAPLLGMKATSHYTPGDEVEARRVLARRQAAGA